MILSSQLVLAQFFLPLVWAISFFIAPLRLERQKKIFALVGALLGLGLSFVLLLSLPDPSSLTLLWETVFPFSKVSYSLYMDGMSGLLVVLNAFLLVIVLLATWDFSSKQQGMYFFCLFFLQWAVNGSLLSINLFSFYLFWEAMLIPLFLLIGIFGGPNRHYASLKFFLYTAFGSLLFLAAIFYLVSLNIQMGKGPFDLTPFSIRSLNLPFEGFLSPQSLVFWAFCLAFFIKVPMFPFHSWLPLAHVEAPTAGSILLAGILLKLGIYGLLRFCLPVFDQAVLAYKDFIIILGIVGVVYGALNAIAQTDMKKVVAFSSVSHMGIILAGCFAQGVTATSGVVFQMIAHGITTTGLFIVVNDLYKRRHTKELEAYGGVAQVMPLLAVALFIILLGSMAVPLTNGFVGEFLLLWGVYEYSPLMAAGCALGVILGPIYSLRLYQKIMLGPIHHPQIHQFKDISSMEYASYMILIVCILLFGLYPSLILNFVRGQL